MPAEPPAGHATVFFDGVCNVCNASVRFIIKRDVRRYFRFAPLQSKHGDAMQRSFGLDPEAVATLVLVENGRAYTRSTAALRIARRLGKLWPLLYALIIVPRFLRDVAYDWFARRRYRWFGKRDACMVPSKDVRDRFLPD